MQLLQTNKTTIGYHDTRPWLTLATGCSLFVDSPENRETIITNHLAHDDMFAIQLISTGGIENEKELTCVTIFARVGHGNSTEDVTPAEAAFFVLKLFPCIQ